MADRAQTIGIITSDELLVLPQYVGGILGQLAGRVGFVAIAKAAGASPIREAKKYLAAYGTSFLWSVAWRSLLKRAFIALGLADDVATVCRKRGVNWFRAGSVNDKAFIDRVAKSGVDVIVSIGCPQIYRKDFIARCGARLLNVHSSLLPKYRGLNAPFWCLRHGEVKTGVTVHTIDDETIDRGTIVSQIEVPILRGDSYFDLARRIAESGPVAVAGGVESVRRGEALVRPGGEPNGDYFRWPSKEDVRAFRANGHRYFKLFQL